MLIEWLLLYWCPCPLSLSSCPNMPPARSSLFAFSLSHGHLLTWARCGRARILSDGMRRHSKMYHGNSTCYFTSEVEFINSYHSNLSLLESTSASTGVWLCGVLRRCWRNNEAYASIQVQSGKAGPLGLHTKSSKDVQLHGSQPTCWVCVPMDADILFLLHFDREKMHIEFAKPIQSVRSNLLIC